MKYEKFLENVKQQVEKTLGEGYDISISHVTKNNSIELDGIVICKKNEKIAPNIYMNRYYIDYERGSEIDGIVQDIIRIYEKSNEEKGKYDINLTDIKSVKQHVVYRLVNYDYNKKLLEKIPYVKFLDLAITFHYLVDDSATGVSTIRITKNHISKLDITVKELMQSAEKNTKAIYPAIIRNMEEIIAEITKADLKEELADVENADEIMDNVLKEVFNNSRIPMYVLTNKSGVNGATTILYKNVLKRFANKIKSDFYIIPSSIHEFILIPKLKELNKEKLKKMVLDVNHTQVAVDEVLSGEVYTYSRLRDTVEL